MLVFVMPGLDHISGQAQHDCPEGTCLRGGSFLRGPRGAMVSSKYLCEHTVCPALGGAAAMWWFLTLAVSSKNFSQEILFRQAWF